MVMFYVYRFLDKKKNIIYVGRTSNIKGRIAWHIDSGHLPLECYLKLDTVEYIELPTRVDSEIIELYLINTIRPMYNKLDLESTDLVAKVSNEYNWIPLDDCDYKLALKYKNQLRIAEIKNKAIQKKYYRMLRNMSSEEVSLEKITEPYYLKELSSKLDYITKNLKISITPTADTQSYYNYIEVISLLRTKPNMKFVSKNKNTDILVYREGSKVVFEDRTNSIVECKAPYFYVQLEEIDRHITYDIGSYNLAGLVPYLQYTIAEV